jgi:hypothetical protein
MTGVEPARAPRCNGCCPLAPKASASSISPHPGWCEGRVRVELTVRVLQAPTPYHLATGPRFLTVQMVSDEALSGPSFSVVF